MSPVHATGHGETQQGLNHIIQKNIGIHQIITSCSVPFHHLPAAPCMLSARPQPPRLLHLHYISTNPCYVQPLVYNEEKYPNKRVFPLYYFLPISEGTNSS